MLAPADGAAPLDGGIRLKERQKLLGIAPPPGGKPAARLTNTAGTGDAVTLAHGNEVAHLHIDNPAGAAIFGDNVNGAQLHDLLLTRRGTAPPTRLDTSLCRIVKTADGVDMRQSVLRGCNNQQVGLKHAVVRCWWTTARSGEREVLDPAAYGAGQSGSRTAARPVAVRRAARGVRPCLGIARVAGVFGGKRASGPHLPRLRTGASITAQITDLRLDSLRDDGIVRHDRLPVLGAGSDVQVPGCAKLAPAPVSDARIVLNIDRLRFTDTLRHGAANSAGVIEPSAYDQGRSAIEIHVQRSDITEAAAAGFFTFYIRGRPAKDVIDFGCVNPDPAGTVSRPAACRRAGYTSIGQNRIFGNSRNSKTYTPLGEIALQGPGAMMAQGNYFGDIAPADGKGDALGECHLMIWPQTLKDELPPVRQHPQRALRAVYGPRPAGSHGHRRPVPPRVGSASAEKMIGPPPRALRRPCAGYGETRRSPAGEDLAVIGRTLGHYQVTGNWAKAGWARFIAPATSTSTATSPSRCCRRACSPTRRHGGGSAVKRRRCPG